MIFNQSGGGGTKVFVDNDIARYKEVYINASNKRSGEMIAYRLAKLPSKEFDGSSYSDIYYPVGRINGKMYYFADGYNHGSYYSSIDGKYDYVLHSTAANLFGTAHEMANTNNKIYLKNNLYWVVFDGETATQIIRLADDVDYCACDHKTGLVLLQQERKFIIFDPSDNTFTDTNMTSKTDDRGSICASKKDGGVYAQGDYSGSYTYFFDLYNKKYTQISEHHLTTDNLACEYYDGSAGEFTSQTWNNSESSRKHGSYYIHNRDGSYTCITNKIEGVVPHGFAEWKSKDVLMLYGSSFVSGEGDTVRIIRLGDFDVYTSVYCAQ